MFVPPANDMTRPDFGTAGVADLSLDPITGYLSRTAGLHVAGRLVAEAKRARVPLAVLWLDIDRFRQINESFGHAGGDSVIARIGERIRQTVAEPRELLRMGSDEFVALLPGMAQRDAELVGRRLLVEVERPLPIDDVLMRPSISIGLAMLQAEDDPLGLLERADRAMAEAQRQGGNRLVMSGDESIPGRLGVQLAREELVIESALHGALEDGGLELKYQPILRPDGSVEAIEALMRCTANGFRIAPAKFIPVAEKTGLIARLGEWSLLQGGRCAARLHQQGCLTKVAINVSRAQLVSPGFLPALHATLICANVPPEFLELELTESLFMDFSPTVQTNLRGAREAGVGLAIDDFGTGFSCLADLKDLLATKLKFDRSFTKVLPDDRRAFAIVQAMSQLARGLGMTVVAEGVETPAQLEACLAAAVDATQGFLHARPMTEEALLMWIETRKQQ